MFLSLFLSASASASAFFLLLPPPFLGSSYFEFIFLQINPVVLNHLELDVLKKHFVHFVFNEVYLQKSCFSLLWLW